MTLNVLDLFSGIGGFSIGLERAGMRTIAFCENDPFCRQILERHWPEIPIFGDIASTGFDGVSADLICGGFPCQDISYRGLGAGIDGLRSGLWREFARAISEVRPRYVVVENTAALLGRGLERVLGDLASLGFDAEWHCIPACAVGAPHKRDRVWIIAYTNSFPRRSRTRKSSTWESYWPETENRSGIAPDATPLLGAAFFRQQSDRAIRRYWPADWQQQLETLRGVDDGVRGRMDGLAAIGNSVVPAIPEIIGRAIMDSL